METDFHTQYEQYVEPDFTEQKAIYDNASTSVIMGFCGSIFNIIILPIIGLCLALSANKKRKLMMIQDVMLEKMIKLGIIFNSVLLGIKLLILIFVISFFGLILSIFGKTINDFNGHNGNNLNIRDFINEEYEDNIFEDIHFDFDTTNRAI